MKILVLIKPALQSVSTPDSDKYITSDLISGPADLAGLEVALRLQDICHAHICVLSMGISRAASVLHDCLARGADEAVLVSDSAFAGSDTCATSRILSEAVRYLGDFDFIFCGRKSTDGETGQVGPQLAALLNRPFVGSCIDFQLQSQESQTVATCTSVSDAIKEIFLVPSPAIISFRNGFLSPRLPSLRGLRKANKIQIQHIDCAMLGFQPGQVGQLGSPTYVRHALRHAFALRHAVPVTDTQAITELIKQYKEQT